MTVAQRALALGRRRELAVAGWGNNAHHQLGAGWGCAPPIAEPIGAILGDVKQLVSLYFSSLALKSDGTVWSWGGGAGTGRHGTPGTRPLPVQAGYGEGEAFTPLTGVVAIAGTSVHSLALLRNGEVRSWGQIGWGQLGNGETSGNVIEEKRAKHEPQVVKNESGTGPLTGITAVGTGLHHSLAINSSGEVLGWGNNTYGQLGNGEKGPEEIYPVKVKLSERAVAVVGGGGGTSEINGGHTLALLQGGTVMAWGKNKFGQLGNGGSEGSNVPVAVKGLENVIAIAASGENSYAIAQAGAETKVFAWGSNKWGQLGKTQDELAHNEPVEVKMPTKELEELGVTSFQMVSISGGEANYVPFGNSCMVVCGGRIVSWGANGAGQLGYKTELKEYEQLKQKVKRMRPNPTPKVVPQAKGIGTPVAVIGGEDHTLAIFDGKGPSKILTFAILNPGTSEEALELQWEWKKEGEHWVVEAEPSHKHGEKSISKKKIIVTLAEGKATSEGLYLWTCTVKGSELKGWEVGKYITVQIKLKPKKEEAIKWVQKGASTKLDEEEGPEVTTLAASSITETTAVLNAVVNPAGAEITECDFEYGVSGSEAEPTVIAVTPLPSGEEPVAVSAKVEGLTASTTYWFRIVAADVEGTSEGETETFATT